MEHQNEILDLILSSAGKAAPYMTEKLRTIGDGKMAEGISALAEYATKAGMEIGEKAGLKKGAILGTLGTLTAVGIIKIVIDFHQKRTERICMLREVDQRMEVSDDKSTSGQEEKNQSCNEELTEQETSTDASPEY